MVQSRQDEALAIIGITASLAFIFAVARLYSRYLGRNFGWDDYLIVVAITLLLGEVLATWKYILLSGTGYHMRDLHPKTIHEQVAAMRWNFAVQMIYHPLMGAIRGSIIMFLFRMKDNRRRIRYSLYMVFCLNILYAISTCLTNMLQCHPINYAFDKAAMDYVDANGHKTLAGTCFDTRTFVLVSCALSILMDLIIIPIPSVVVWTLQMSVRTKILVVLVMSLGWIATGVSVGRLIIYYYRFAPTTTDRTWNIGIAISIVEPSVHIMCACAPATKCLFRSLFPTWASDRSSDYYEPRASRQPSKTLRQSSRMSRITESFHFGLSHHERNITVVTASQDGSTKYYQNEVSITYDLQQLEARSTRPYIGGHTGDPLRKKKRCVEVRKSARTSVPKTPNDDSSEPVEAEPEHCLEKVI